jgi:hypothetical protein
MVTTIDSTALFFGAPASLTVGGTEVGATLTPPVAKIESTQYAPDFQGAGGPIKGAVFNTKIKATIEFDVNEITATKLTWALPGSVVAGTPSVWTWSIGRVASTVFKDVVLDGIGLDGRHLTVTVKDALSDGKFDITMSDAAVIGAHVVMTGYYDGANPKLAPMQILVG